MAQVAPAVALTISQEPLTNDDNDVTDGTNVTAVELHRNRRVIYFKDGPVEESSSSDSDDNDALDKGLDVHINEDDLPFMSRAKNRATRLGSNILAGIDYVGGGLASFFGISTLKYASEIEYYEERKAELERDVINEGRWISVSTSGAEVITNNQPRHDINRNNIP